MHCVLEPTTAVQRSESRNGAQPLAELALWLTEQEAQAMALLCLSAREQAGPAEEALFGKLGEFLRQFRAEQR